MNAQDGSCKPAVETGRVEVIYGGRNDPLDSVKGLAAVADVTLPSDVVLGQIKLSDTMLGPGRDDESNRNFDSSTVTFVEQPSFQNKDLTSQTTYTNIHDSGVEPVDHIDEPLPEHHSTTVINPMMNGVEAGERTENGERTGSSRTHCQVPSTVEQRKSSPATADLKVDDKLCHEELCTVDKRQVEFVQHFDREESADSSDPLQRSDPLIKDEESNKYLVDTKVIFVSDKEDVRSSKPFETEDDSSLLEKSSIGPSLDLEAKPSMTDVRCISVEQRTPDIFYQISTTKEVPPIEAPIEATKISDLVQPNKKSSNVVESSQDANKNVHNKPNDLQNSTSPIFNAQSGKPDGSADKKDSNAVSATDSPPVKESPRVVNVHAKSTKDDVSNSVQRTNVAPLNPNAPIYTPINSYSIDHQTDSRLEIIYETAFSSGNELDPNIPITLPVINNDCRTEPATPKLKETFCKVADNEIKNYMDNHVRIVVGTPCNFNAVDKYLALGGSKTDDDFKVNLPPVNVNELTSNTRNFNAEDKYLTVIGTRADNDSKGILQTLNNDLTFYSSAQNTESKTLLTSKNSELVSDISSLDFRNTTTDPEFNKSKSNNKMETRSPSPELSDADSISSKNDELPRKYRPPTPGVQRIEREFRPANLRPPTPAPLAVYEEGSAPEENEMSEPVFEAESPSRNRSDSSVNEVTEDSVTESTSTVLDPNPSIESNRSQSSAQLVSQPEIDPGRQTLRSGKMDEVQNLPQTSDITRHDDSTFVEDKAPLPPPRRLSDEKKSKRSFNFIRKIFGFKSK